jgi:hypothetical protein
MKPFILIAGCPRSGTTLIRNMLNAHPDIYIFPQTQFFNKVWGSRRLVAYKKNREKLLNIIASDRAVLRDELDMFSEQNLSRRNFDNYCDEYIQIIEDNNLFKKKIIGDKTPRHIFFIDKIKCHMKHNLKTIVAVRDSRAVIASLKKRGMIGSVAQGAAIWNFFLERITTLLNTLTPEEIIYIRYEDLVSDPVNITRELSSFLNLGYSEHMLNVKESNSSYTRKPQKGIYKDSLFQWQEEFNQEEIHVISQLTKNYLFRFDYCIASSNEPVGARTRLHYYFYRAAEHAITSMMKLGFFPTQGLSYLKKIFNHSSSQKA